MNFLDINEVNACPEDPVVKPLEFFEKAETDAISPAAVPDRRELAKPAPQTAALNRFAAIVRHSSYPEYVAPRSHF